MIHERIAELEFEMAGIYCAEHYYTDMALECAICEDFRVNFKGEWKFFKRNNPRKRDRILCRHALKAFMVGYRYGLRNSKYANT